MLSYRIYFVLLTILGDSARQSDGEKIPTPYIRTVVRHTDVTLDCPHTIQFERVVNWFFSPVDQPSIKPIHNDRRFMQTLERNNSLLIRNVTNEEAGMFICCFHGPCVNMFLVVLEFENILSFTPGSDDASGEIIVSSEGELSIVAHHSPDLSVDLFKEPNIAVCDYFAGKAVCYKKKRKKSTTYHLKNVKLQNSGQFEIRSTSDNFSGSHHLNVLIQGHPVVHIESNYTEDGIKLVCRGKAYPPPFIELRFVPAAMSDSDSVSSILLQSLSVSNHSANISATAEIKQPISGPGTVECKANNSGGIAYAVSPLFLEHFVNATPVTSSRSSGSIPRNQMQFVVTSPIGAVNAGATVLLQCKASFYEFSNSFVLQYKGDSFPIDGIEQDDFWVANFTLIASREELAVCDAQFKNGSKISKRVKLPLVQAFIEEFDHETEQKIVLPKHIIKWIGYFIIVISLVGVFSSAVILPLWIKLSKSRNISNQLTVAENNAAHCLYSPSSNRNPDYLIRQTVAARSINGAVGATGLQRGRVEVTDL